MDFRDVLIRSVPADVHRWMRVEAARLGVTYAELLGRMVQRWTETEDK